MVSRVDSTFFYFVMVSRLDLMLSKINKLLLTLLLLFLSDSLRTPVRQGILWRARGSGQAQIKPAKDTGGKPILAVYWTFS